VKKTKSCRVGGTKRIKCWCESSYAAKSRFIKDAAGRQIFGKIYITGFECFINRTSAASRTSFRPKDFDWLLLKKHTLIPNAKSNSTPKPNAFGKLQLPGNVRQLTGAERAVLMCENNIDNGGDGPEMSQTSRPASVTGEFLNCPRKESILKTSSAALLCKQRMHRQQHYKIGEATWFNDLELCNTV